MTKCELNEIELMESFENLHSIFRFVSFRFFLIFGFFTCVSQAALAKEQAERNSLANLEKIEENEKRMEVAQGNMKKMLEKVNEETRAVEEAIEDLKRAQAATEGGIDSQLVDLKSGGLVKQAALAGGLLFTLRSGAETIAFLAGDPSHALPALIQGALAIAFIIGFVFL